MHILASKCKTGETEGILARSYWTHRPCWHPLAWHPLIVGQTVSASNQHQLSEYNSRFFHLCCIACKIFFVQLAALLVYGQLNISGSICMPCTCDREREFWRKRFYKDKSWNNDISSMASRTRCTSCSLSWIALPGWQHWSLINTRCMSIVSLWQTVP